MFCPKCATQNIDGTSYCRSCGVNISLIPQALSGQLPTADKPQCLSRPARKGLRQREPSIEEAIRTITMGVAFTVVSILVLEYAPAGPIWWFWMLIPAFGCFGKGFAEVARLRMNKRKSSVNGQPQLNSVRQPVFPAQRTGELRTPAPSVTEGTTRHLGVETQTPLDYFDNQKPS